MPSWSWAVQPNLIRAAQKDAFFVDTLVQELREAASLLLGPRRLAKLHSEIDLVAAALYYGVQVLERKTLGEEYCDLERVTSDWRLPTRRRLASLVFLQVAFPYLISKLRPISSSTSAAASCYNRLLSVLSSQTQLSTITRLNVAIFYLFGVYLHLSNRVVGVRYLQTVPAPSGSNSIYRLLGVLIIAQISISAALRLYQARLKRFKMVRNVLADTEESLSCSPGPNCTLCLGPKRAPTVTDCGHVFCWKCIASWCSNKPECPLCRQPIVLSNLVRLCNY